MQLTEAERDALERLRYMHFYDGSLIEIPTKRYDDLMTVLGMSERLLPVRTYGNLVIRWDDPVTPERLQACGFVYVEREDSGNKCYQYHAMVKGIHSTYINVRAFSRFTGSSEITIVQGSFRYEIDGQYVSIPHEYQPRNMLEVWQLMERCGITQEPPQPPPPSPQ